jgi:hypothetical protein
VVFFPSIPVPVICPAWLLSAAHAGRFGLDLPANITCCPSVSKGSNYCFGEILEMKHREEGRSSSGILSNRQRSMINVHASPLYLQGIEIKA